MRRVYLDSNILIAHYAVDKSEEPKKALVENALNVFAELRDVQLWTSMWAIPFGQSRSKLACRV